jgi:hypothetical protein
MGGETSFETSRRRIRAVTSTVFEEIIYMSIELKQGLILKSSDGEYVYNIYSYQEGHPTMQLDILDKHLATVASKPNYSVEQFKTQIEAGTIVEFQPDEMIGQNE